METAIPTIGVAMIARDSAGTIEVALRSVQPIAAQIVVVDTGSTDATPKVARQLEAEVYFHPWSDDFSAARNVALSYLRTDWALVLDSDEELDRESFEAERHWLSDPAVGGIDVRILSELEGGAVAEHRYTRLVRCHRGIRFRGRIHEQIAESVRAAGFAIVSSSICIRHYGYRQLSPEKLARNIALLEMELQQQPDSAWYRYHLGLAYVAAARYAQAFELLTPLVQHPELSRDQQELAAIRAAQCALALDDVLSAEKLLQQPCSNLDREGLRLFVLAGVFAAQRRLAQALDVLENPATCRSAMVSQEQRCHFAERLAQLLRRSSAEWSALFR